MKPKRKSGQLHLNNKYSPRREKVILEVPGVLDENVGRLRDLYPQVFVEGKIDFEKLRTALGGAIDKSPDRFTFSWAGRNNAVQLLQMPTRATLVPMKEESLNYDGAKNIFIEGDNLEVLKLLYKPYFGKVRMIYVDPPYNTGNDFVYSDDYSDPLESYLQISGQKSAEGNLLTSNPETSGRFHSSWLSMMYPRLFLARQLLREDGSLCVSIGEEEYASLRLILNEIMGEENYRNTIIVRRYDKNLSRQFMEQGLKSLATGVEFVIIYAKSSQCAFNPVYRESSEERQSTGYWKGFWNAPDRPTMRYDLFGFTPKTGQWKWRKEVALEAVENYKTYQNDYSKRMSLEEYWEKAGKKKRFIRLNPRGSSGKNGGVEHWVPPSEGILRSSNWTDILASSTLTNLHLTFDNPKNPRLIEELIRLCTDEEDLILDFFAGSCTTAEAVLNVNKSDSGSRQFIMVQLPEPTPEGSDERRAGFKTVSDIGKERIRRAISQMQPSLDKSYYNGFKVFKLSESNFRPWKGVAQRTPEDYAREMQEQVDSLVKGWVIEDVIYEVAVKEGYSLNSTIRKEKYQENEIWRITEEGGEPSFLICLDEALSSITVKNLEVSPHQLFVCRDIALDDTAAANLALQCRLKTL